MAHSPKDALHAAKEDLLAAYSAVHSSLGRLINLVHNSEPRAVADALASEYVPHSQSPPQNHHPVGTAGYGHRSSQPAEQSKYPKSTPLYPAPPQPHSSAHARINAPPGPSFMTVTPGAPRQLNYAPVQPQKVRHKKQQPPPPTHSYAPQPTQPLETDEEEDDDDDPDEPVSEEDQHRNESTSAYYNPPPQRMTNSTQPDSIPGGKKKRVKRERDPNAPKRPASAYILFQNAVRQEMRAANPTADYKELARQIGDRWKNLSEDDKRPWSEAGKLAMHSWNIQNKEYKISHPDLTSPHNQSNGNQIPGPHKRRSRVVNLDDLGNPLPKKRGRPSKNEKDLASDNQVHPGQFGGLQRMQSNHNMQIDSINSFDGASAHQPSVPGGHGHLNHGTISPAHGIEYSEEDEAEEDEEEEEEEEEVGKSHPQVPPTSFQQPNGTSRISSHMAPTDSDMDEGDDDESVAEPTSYINNKIGVQANGILA